MSICEKMSFKCTECYQSFLTQADLQCHVYDHHQQRDPPSVAITAENKDVKQEEIAVEVNGNAEKEDDKTEKSMIKLEKQDEVDVKVEREKDDEDEELIDVGENNRNDEKNDDDADTH